MDPTTRQRYKIIKKEYDSEIIDKEKPLSNFFNTLKKKKRNSITVTTWSFVIIIDDFNAVKVQKKTSFHLKLEKKNIKCS